MDTFTTLVLCIGRLLTANGHIMCISSFSETPMNYPSLDVKVDSALGSGEISGSLATLAGARAGGSPHIS